MGIAFLCCPCLFQDIRYFILSSPEFVKNELTYIFIADCVKDEVHELHDLVVQYAPRLRFDSKSGDTLGQCLPSSAEDYFRLRQNGFTGRV